VKKGRRSAMADVLARLSSNPECWRWKPAYAQIWRLEWWCDVA
jgi:hypothetical protein